MHWKQYHIVGPTCCHGLKCHFDTFRWFWHPWWWGAQWWQPQWFWRPNILEPCLYAPASLERVERHPDAFVVEWNYRFWWFLPWAHESPREHRGTCMWLIGHELGPANARPVLNFTATGFTYALADAALPRSSPTQNRWKAEMMRSGNQTQLPALRCGFFQVTDPKSKACCCWSCFSTLPNNVHVFIRIYIYNIYYMYLLHLVDDLFFVYKCVFCLFPIPSMLVYLHTWIPLKFNKMKVNIQVAGNTLGP